MAAVALASKEKTAANIFYSLFGLFFILSVMLQVGLLKSLIVKCADSQKALSGTKKLGEIQRLSAALQSELLAFALKEKTFQIYERNGVRLLSQGSSPDNPAQAQSADETQRKNVDKGINPKEDGSSPERSESLEADNDNADSSESSQPASPKKIAKKDVNSKQRKVSPKKKEVLGNEELQKVVELLSKFILLNQQF